MAEAQHTVPRGYLVGFADEKKCLVVMDRRRPLHEQLRAQVRTPIGGVSTRPDQYTLRRSTGLYNGPERAFKLMEDPLFRIRKALRSGPLSDEALRDWVVLAGAQFFRGRNRTMMARPYGQMIEAARRDAVAEGREPDEAERDLVRDRIHDGDIMRDPENLALVAGPKVIQATLDLFNKMYKCVLTSDGEEFITSDEPVVFFDPVAMANRIRQALKRVPQSLACEVTFPLTRRYCLLMSYRRIVSESRADDAVVETVNSRTARFCREEIYVSPCDERGQDAILRAITSGTASLRSLAVRYAMPHDVSGAAPA